jgi:DNA-binding Lrp family transcriptional regulator
MLRRFLEMVRTGEVQSLLEIARSMDISPDMALQIMQELTKKGYLEEIGTDCEQPQKGCSDCPLNSTCQETVRRWFLTEKGRSVISSM